MKFISTLSLATLIIASACSNKPETGVAEPETIEMPSESPIATPVDATGCTQYSSDYSIAYIYGETELTEGQQEALDAGFEKLLPIVTECGNFHVTLVTTTADSEVKAIERATTIQNIFNEKYFVPLNLIDIETAEPDILTTTASDDPTTALRPEVVIQLRVDKPQD